MTFNEYRETIASSPETKAAPLHATWTIGPRVRTATLNGYSLMVTNHRSGILGPVLWSVSRGSEVVANGGVFRSKRYISLTREAMRLAEAAAMGS